MSEVRHLFQQASAAFDAGRYEEAEDFLLQIVGRTPTYANVFNMLGFIASQRDFPEKAVSLFRRALSLNPSYHEARLNLVLTLADMGAYAQAAQEAVKLEDWEGPGAPRFSLAVRGKLANAHAELGHRYHKLGMYSEAITEYDKALGMCPNFPDLHIRRAASCRELGRYAEAKDWLLKALEIKPDYVDAHVNLGLIHQKLGSLTDAVTSWERALQLDPKHRLARIYLKQATASETATG